MIIAGTGHRPGKIFDYSPEAFTKLINLASEWLEENKPDKVISGMAMGWDMALAQATIDKNIPLICAIPCKNQDKMWSHSIRFLYSTILLEAVTNPIHDVVYVSTRDYDNKCMQKRNEWMVDNSDTVLALWDGSIGGTNNCLKYAEKKRRKIINLYESWKKN